MQKNLPPKIPRLYPLCPFTLRLGPLAPIRQRAQMRKLPYRKDDEHSRDLQPHPGSQRRRDQVEHGAQEEDGKVERWKVVVEEQLAAHEKEGKVVQEPACKEEPAKSVVFDNFC